MISLVQLTATHVTYGGDDKTVLQSGLHLCSLCIWQDGYVNKEEQKCQLPVLRRCGSLADIPKLFSSVALHHI